MAFDKNVKDFFYLYLSDKMINDLILFLNDDRYYAFKEEYEKLFRCFTKNKTLKVRQFKIEYPYLDIDRLISDGFIFKSGTHYLLDNILKFPEITPPFNLLNVAPTNDEIITEICMIGNTNTVKMKSLKYYYDLTDEDIKGLIEDGAIKKSNTHYHANKTLLKERLIFDINHNAVPLIKQETKPICFNSCVIN